MYSKMTSLLTCLFLLTLVSTASAITIGKPAPDFTLLDTSGRPVTLSSFTGKVVVLNFWATTCPPCLAELPSLEDLHRHLLDRGGMVLGVAIDHDLPAVKEVMARKKISFPVLLDPNKEVSFDSYALFGLPITLIISKEGVVVDRVIGEAAWNSPEMKEKIDKLLRGGERP
ncbi:MAG TPA: TlpA disulfide reductase family protein [Geobacterales bacterium]|nr:TlpA disulfide reductase family protein [Geobacterales bacterium]